MRLEIRIIMIIDYVLPMIIIFGLLFGFFNIFILLKPYNNKKPELADFPKVSIIVPAYNEENNIKDAVMSLINLDYPKDKLEIIVIDDGSEDNTFEKAKEIKNQFPEIVKVIKQKNKGKAAALNNGIKNSTGDVIVTLDADSVVPKDALKKMIPVLFSDKKVMIVVPAIQVKRKKTFVEKIQSIEYTYNNTLREIFRRLNALYIAPGPFSIFKKEFFDKLGYFDEGNLTEDMEIAMRCHSSGYKVEYCKEVLVLTDAPKNLRSLIKQRVRWYTGFLYNYNIYKDKLNNEILAKIIFPSAFSFIIAGFATVMIFFYFNLRSLYNIIEYFYIIGFGIKHEVIYFLNNFDLNTTLETTLFALSINSTWVSFLSFFFFAMFIGMIMFSWRYENNKSVVSLLMYQFLYLFIYVIFWVAVVYYKVTKKPIRWGKKIWIDGKIIEKNN